MKSKILENSIKKCFVCGTESDKSDFLINQEVNLYVCKNCSGSEKETILVKEMLDSLADGFVCGCI